jgi:hypothetical protein
LDKSVGNDDLAKAHGLFTPFTLSGAQELKCGDRIWFIARGGDARPVKVTNVKTWVRRPHKVVVGLKYGLREYFTYNETEIHSLLAEVSPEALAYADETLKDINDAVNASVPVPGEDAEQADRRIHRILEKQRKKHDI